MSSPDVVGVEDANGVGNEVRARVFGMLWLVGDGPAGVAVVVADHESAAIGEHPAEALLPPEHRPPDAHDEQNRWISEVAKGLRAELDTTHGDHALRQLHPPLGLLAAPSASHVYAFPLSPTSEQPANLKDSMSSGSSPSTSTSFGPRQPPKTRIRGQSITRGGCFPLFTRRRAPRALATRSRSDRCAAGEPPRRAAAHLPLRDPHRMRGATSPTDAHAWSVVEPSGRNGWQCKAEILDMKPGRTTAAHTHDLTMVSSGDNRSDACLENRQRGARTRRVDQREH